MVESDRFNNRSGQAPDGQQAGADVGVRGAEDPVFKHMQTGFFLLCELDSLAKRCRQIGGKQNFAQIVQQPGGVSLLGQIGLLLFEHDDLAGKLADQDGVEPEFIDRKAGLGQTVEFGKSVGQEHEGAGGFQAEIGHGFGRLIYLQMQPEDGGVGQLEDFGSDGGILRDDFADGFDGSRRRFHFQSDTKVEARGAGDPTQFSDQGLSLGTGRPRSWGRDMVQSADQHRDVAWL